MNNDDVHGVNNTRRGSLYSRFRQAEWDAKTVVGIVLARDVVGMNKSPSPCAGLLQTNPTGTCFNCSIRKKKCSAVIIIKRPIIEITRFSFDTPPPLSYTFFLIFIPVKHFIIRNSITPKCCYRKIIDYE